MRDLVELVGLGHVAAFLERIVSGEGTRVAALAQQQQQQQQQQGQGGQQPGQGQGQGQGASGDLVGTSWTQLESSLYAANVALAALHEGGAQGGRCAHACGSRLQSSSLGSLQEASRAARVPLPARLRKGPPLQSHSLTSRTMPPGMLNRTELTLPSRHA